jgi:hypothetical protein
MRKPTMSGWPVMRYAFPRLPSAIILPNASNVELNGGKAALSGQRPTASQRLKANAKEATSQRIR